MDVIKRDYVAEIIEKLSSSGQFTPENMMMSVNALPDALVRCEDCKKCSHDTMFGTRWCHGHEVKPDDFCSYGERKADG